MSASLGRDTRSGTERSPTAAGPSRMWWVAHAIAGGVLGGLPLSWGLVVLARGQTSLPALRGALVLHGGAARLFAFALFAAAAGLFAHAFLTCFERIKHRAVTAANAACALALLLLIAALVHHALA